MRTDGRFGHLLRQMPIAMVDRIFAAMPKIEALHGIPAEASPQLDIGFFGGEPLLAANRPIVEHVLRRGLDRGAAKFWAISNGTELDAYEDLLSPELLGSVQITLDGPPPSTTGGALYADGRGSWDRIARQYLDGPGPAAVLVAIRTNVDRNNVDDLADLAEELDPAGLGSISQLRLAGRPRSAPPTTRRMPARRSTTWELDRLLTAMRSANPDLEILGPGGRLAPQPGPPHLLPPRSPRFQTELLLGAHGDVHLRRLRRHLRCWEKTGDEKIRIGHVDERSEVQFSIRSSIPLAGQDGRLESRLSEVPLQPLLRRRLRRPRGGSYGRRFLPELLRRLCPSLPRRRRGGVPGPCQRQGIQGQARRFL